MSIQILSSSDSVSAHVSSYFRLTLELLAKYPLVVCTLTVSLLTVHGDRMIYGCLAMSTSVAHLIPVISELSAKFCIAAPLLA